MEHHKFLNSTFWIVNANPWGYYPTGRWCSHPYLVDTFRAIAQWHEGIHEQIYGNYCDNNQGSNRDSDQSSYWFHIDSQQGKNMLYYLSWLRHTFYPHQSLLWNVFMYQIFISPFYIVLFPWLWPSASRLKEVTVNLSQMTGTWSDEQMAISLEVTVSCERKTTVTSSSDERMARAYLNLTWL